MHVYKDSYRILIVLSLVFATVLHHLSLARGAGVELGIAIPEHTGTVQAE